MMIFLTTENGYGGLKANIEGYTRLGLLKRLEEYNDISQIRLMKLDSDEPAQLTTKMTIEEFDSVFDRSDFSKENIEKYFSVEIKNALIQGVEKPKPISQKDIGVGDILRTKGNDVYLYIGKRIVTTRSCGRFVEEKEGHSYVYLSWDEKWKRYISDPLNNRVNSSLRIETTKSPKKFMELLQRGFEVDENRMDIRGRDYYFEVSRKLK